MSCSSKRASASLRSSKSTAPRSNAMRSWSRLAGRVVHQVPPADVADCGDDLRLDASAAAAVVSRDLSPDPDQTRHLQHRTGPSPRGDADHRLEGQTQVEAG